MSKAAPRTSSRAGIDSTTRLILIEQDLDEHDDRFESVAAEVAGVKKVLVGILISITTGIIVLAATQILTASAG